MNYNVLMKEALKRSNGFDMAEKKDGYKSIGMMNFVELVSAAMGSLESCIKYNDIMSAAEAQVILYDLHRRLGGVVERKEWMS